MQTVTVSPKYQVVIPKRVRRGAGIKPGQKMLVMEYNGRVELVPEKDISELRGLLKGADIRFERERDRL